MRVHRRGRDASDWNAEGDGNEAENQKNGHDLEAGGGGRNDVDEGPTANLYSNDCQ